MECDRLFYAHPMAPDTVYQLALEAEGVPEELAEFWAPAVALADSTSPADLLALGLYRYFVGGRDRGQQSESA